MTKVATRKGVETDLDRALRDSFDYTHSEGELERMRERHEKVAAAVALIITVLDRHNLIDAMEIEGLLSHEFSVV